MRKTRKWLLPITVLVLSLFSVETLYAKPTETEEQMASQFDFEEATQAAIKPITVEGEEGVVDQTEREETSQAAEETTAAEQSETTVQSQENTPEPKQSILAEMKSGFDYSVYSKATIEDFVSIINKMEKESPENKNFFDFLLFEIQGVKFKGTEDVSGYYVVQDRINYGFNDIPLKITEDMYLPAATEASKFISKMEFSYDLDTIREEEIEWSKHFLEIMNPNFDYSTKNFELKSINIYEYFADGVYSAPVKNPSLSRISRPYEKDHYGIDISMEENENVLSVANNAQVLVKDNTVNLIIKNNVVITYTNITPCVNTGDIVNAGEKIGTYTQKNPAYDGLFFTLTKDKKEKCTEWMMTELPFITNHGMSMPLYIQFDDIFSDYPFGSSQIGPSGCGPSSLSMAISYLKNEIITPAEVVEKMGGANCRYYIPGAGSSWSIMLDCPPEFGVKSKALYSSEVKAALERGNPVIVLMREGEFTSGGHFITLSGFDSEGKVYVNDSADSKWKEHYARTFTLDQIFAESGGGYWELWVGDNPAYDESSEAAVDQDIVDVQVEDISTEISRDKYLALKEKQHLEQKSDKN